MDSIRIRESVEELEKKASENYRQQQSRVLAGRHSPEDVIRWMVITDYCHSAALKAKDGKIQHARSEIQTLDKMATGISHEMECVYQIASLPVWALIEWLSDNPYQAIINLKKSLEHCTCLAEQFNHQYLTLKQFHLAFNIAHVLASINAFSDSRNILESLILLASGTHAESSFLSADTLCVPLKRSERQLFDFRFKKIESLIISGDNRQVDSITQVICRHCANGTFDGWKTFSEQSNDSVWMSYSLNKHRRLNTGFKIHVSSNIKSSGDVLNKCIPILREMGVEFKHAKNNEKLSFLSSGKAGSSQVGKFITAYPKSLIEAETISERFHEVTKGLSGPRIQYERAFCEGSLVYCRYGSFSQNWLQKKTGRIVLARTNKYGILEEDNRQKNSHLEQLLSFSEKPKAQ